MAGKHFKLRGYREYVSKWANKLRSGKNIAHSLLEKPAMYGMLPNLKGKTILCVGCGTGEECQYIKSLGAKIVVGIDISKVYIDYAKQSFPGLEFYVMDMRSLAFAKNSFDFVYSSLAMHYVKSWDKVLTNIHGVLKKNGVFLFSTHHPVKWAADIVRSNKVDKFTLGYKKYKKGNSEIFGDYFTVREINDTWFGEMEVSYFHQPISKMFFSIIESGFDIINFVEPMPTRMAKNKYEDFYNIHTKIPLFIIFKLRKQK